MPKPLLITDYVDEDLKLVRDGDGTDTAIQLSKDRMKIVGDLDVTGNIDSATIYAGQILGYTRLQGDLTNQGSFEIQNSMTIEDDTHKIAFKTPPSENVEIEATFLINAVSTDTRIEVGLSDSSTYNSVGAEFEYDGNGIFFTDDEVDDQVCSSKFILGASQLASVGSNNTFWIGFSTGGVTKSAYINYGHRASHGITDHPFIIKATALPIAIYDGQ